MALSSVQIYRRSINRWDIVTNESPLPTSRNYYHGGDTKGLFTITGATGNILIPPTSWEAFEYIDEYGSNSFIPISAADLMQRLLDEGFFVEGSSGGGGGATAFTMLTDTFGYLGNGGKVVAVKADATGLEPIPYASIISPNLQNVTDSGATTTNPLQIGVSGDSLKLESDRIVRSKGGNDTRITFDDPTASFSVNIRELSADEEIAFLSDILPTGTATIVLQDKGYQTVSMTVTRNTGTGIEKNDVCRVFLDTGEWGWYQYNGSGDTQDILNYTLIQSTTVNIV